MALTQSQVRVAGSGEVYVAPSDTAAPTDLAALPSAWTGLGYCTTDGVTWTLSRETTDLNAWQGDKLRVLTTAEPVTIEFALMETSPDTLLVALGGGTITPGTGIATIEPPAKGEGNVAQSCVVDFVDGTIKYRYYIPKVQLEGDVSWQLQRADSLNYSVTFGVLDNDPKFLVLTDDPAFVGGALVAASDSDVAEYAAT